MKKIRITLSLVDKLVSVPRGMVKDVLVQIDKLYNLVDFVVLDTTPIKKGVNVVQLFWD